MSQEFALYIDESGSPKPNRKDKTPHFAMGGVLVRRKDEGTIHQAVAEFKERWNIDEHIPLHGSEIRSRKKNFTWLEKHDKDTQDRFHQDLADMIAKFPIIVHGCVVSRCGYLDCFEKEYGSKTWEMMKSAFSILLERVAKYINLHGGKVVVYFEKAGKKEDKLITNYFNEMKFHGAPFNPQTSSKYKPFRPEQLQQVLAGIEGKSKSNPILQIADLCLYPIARAKEQSQSRALQALRQHQKLVDEILEPDVLEEMGIKYYCF